MRHHHHIACRVLGLVTCFGPINSQEFFWGVFLGFISHVVVHSPNMLYPFISAVLNFRYNCVNFKLS